MTQDRLDATLAAIDPAAPTFHEDDAGAPTPEALFWGKRMSTELARLVPGAFHHLAVACRGRHFERRALKRADHPEGRAGCFALRREQARRHGARVAGIIAEAGRPEEDAERVASLLRKEALKRNPEARAFGDVVCFVLPRGRFAPFVAERPHDTALDIVASTARKMSDDARAVAEFDPPPEFEAAVVL